MAAYQVVIDTNVLVSGLRSQEGASFKLLSLVGRDKSFEINLSVPLVLEYEEAAKRNAPEGLTTNDIDDIIDYLCAVAHCREVFYLWRPFLQDPDDDMVLELAVGAGCDFIVTYNQKDFMGSMEFGIEVLTPKGFLRKIGAVP